MDVQAAVKRHEGRMSRDPGPRVPEQVGGTRYGGNGSDGFEL